VDGYITVNIKKKTTELYSLKKVSSMVYNSKSITILFKTYGNLNKFVCQYKLQNSFSWFKQAQNIIIIFKRYLMHLSIIFTPLSKNSGVLEKGRHIPAKPDPLKSFLKSHTQSLWPAFHYLEGSHTAMSSCKGVWEHECFSWADCY
jgi:hypothetical protein